MEDTLVLVNNTKKEWLWYGGHLGDGQTVSGILELISRLAWSTDDNIQITKDKYITPKQRKDYVQYFVKLE